MTVRAVILGVLAGVLIASLSFLNDWVLGLFWLMNSQVPVSVFGPLVLLVVLGNPLLGRLHRAWAFDRRELAVMVSLALVAGSLGNSTLFRCWPNLITVPMEMAQRDASWKRTGVLSHMPAAMLPDAHGEHFGRTIGVLNGGMPGAAGGRVHVGRLPWDRWTGTLRFWWPMLALFLVGSVAMAVMVHPQWSHHELLRYPIARFTSLLTDTDGGRAPAMIRLRSFWIAFAAVMALHLINGLQTHYPGMIHIPMTVELTALTERWPGLRHGIGSWNLVLPTLYVSTAAFVLFMRSDVALSLGLSAPLLMFVSAGMVGAGFTNWGSRGWGGYLPWLTFGGFLGLVLVIVYTGRHYYRRVLARALVPRRTCGIDPPRHAVRAARLWLACTAGMVAVLAWTGCPWTMAAVFVAVLTITMIVVARLVAESGLLHVGMAWSPIAVMLGLFGAAAAGPTALLATGLVGAILMTDVRTLSASVAVNALKLCEDSRLPPGRAGRWMTVALVLAMTLGLGVVLWTHYNFGSGGDRFTTDHLPRQVFEPVIDRISRLAYTDDLAASLSLSPLQRLWHARPDPAFLWSAGIGLALVLLTGAVRLRWTWWPIHPVLFVVWGTWPSQMLAPSIFLGWLVRTAIVRVGGARKLHDFQPAAAGAIVGDLLGALVFMLSGYVNYAQTGTRGPLYLPYAL